MTIAFCTGMFVVIFFECEDDKSVSVVMAQSCRWSNRHSSYGGHVDDEDRVVLNYPEYRTAACLLVIGWHLWDKNDIPIEYYS